MFQGREHIWNNQSTIHQYAVNTLRYSGFTSIYYLIIGYYGHKLVHMI